MKLLAALVAFFGITPKDLPSCKQCCKDKCHLCCVKPKRCGVNCCTMKTSLK